MGRYTRNLVAASVLYLGSAAVGTAVAVAEHLPARFAGILNGNNVLLDFVALYGTGLSAPLFMLVAQAVFTVLLFRGGRAERAGVIGLTVLGVLYTIGQLGEPVLYSTLNPSSFDPLLAAIVACNLVFPMAMLVFGLLTWRHQKILAANPL